ncbi:MAG: glycosyltransferase [Flavobacteriales bacterium]|nr:glycosyltransferase [Flavobacteriales bacterium]
MKKVLFICLHRPDRSPSQRFRFEQYIDYLKDNGYDCKHVFLLNQARDKTFYSSEKHFGKALVLLNSLWILIRESFFKKYDIVFVQREAFMLGTPYFEKRFAKRSKLIFDLDDSIWRQQTGEIKSNNKLLYFLKDPNKTKDIIKTAHTVFAGNQYLADYALQSNKNVKIIPTTIDTVIYAVIPKREDKKVCIGWSGSFSTIIHFEFVVKALTTLKEKYGDRIYFKVIGDGTYKNENLGIQGIPWVKKTEIEDFSEIDIGLMPLPDDEWTKGKCALKGLQYMSLGIPCIMSPIGVNRDIIEDGVNGFLASTNEEWIERLSKLIESFELRQKVGAAGRKTVEDGFSVQANKPLYLKYFKELTDNLDCPFCSFID